MEETDSREYFRIEVRLPIEFRKISHEEYLNLENTVRYSCTRIVDKINEVHFLKETVSKDDKENGQVHAYMRMIDSKLDMILDLLSKAKEGASYTNRYMNVSVSGSGVSFTSDVEFREGEYVDLKVILPIPPYPKITTLCHVTRGRAVKVNGAAEYEAALRFSVINEDDRDLLINYIFTKEREFLRNRKELIG